MAFQCEVVEYAGDDSTRQEIDLGIVGVPDMAWVIRPISSASFTYKLWNNSNDSKRLASSPVSTVGIIELIDGGIAVAKVGGSSTTNHASETTYRATALKGAGGDFAVGEYTGDGVSDNVNISVGFQPDFVFAVPRVGFPRYWTVTKGGDASASLGGVNGTFTANGIQGVDSDGFQVGTILYGAQVHYWAAWKNTANTIQTGSYTGDGSTGRSITIPNTVTNTPDRELFIQKEKSSTAFSTFTNSFDASDTHVIGNRHSTTAVQSFGATNFVVDDDVAVNDDTFLHHFLMMQTAPAAPSGRRPPGAMAGMS